MPSKKSVTPEAAQNRLRLREKRALEKQRAAVLRSASSEFRQSQKLADAAATAARKTHRQHLATAKRIVAREEREIAAIDRRIAILNGRLGA